MHLAILSRGEGWHVADLIRAARELGICASAVDFRTLHDRSLDRFDAAVIRTMPAGSLEQIVFRMDVLQSAFESGMPIWNPPKAAETCVDKFLTTVRLKQRGIPTPDTRVCQTLEIAMTAFDELGRDVVIKPLFGSEGRGIVRVHDVDLAWRTFHAIEQMHSAIYLQRFIPHPGWDIRAFVVRDRVVGAMKRTNTRDWRTNVARGGSTERIDLAASERNLALCACRATGAVYAGVDLLLTASGEWIVIEVNAVPGWKALAPVCGIDVAKLVLMEMSGEPTTR